MTFTRKTQSRKPAAPAEELVERTVIPVSSEVLDGETEPDFDLDPEEDEAPPEKTAPDSRPSAMTAIIGAAFGAAISKEVRRRLTHAQALAVIVLVPTSAWVKPAAAYFGRSFGQRWITVARDGSDRRHHMASVGSDVVAGDLARGRCVAGLAADVGALPAALVAAADLTIRLAAPTAPVLRAAITKFARRSPGELAEDLVAGLDLNDIVAAFRPGSGAGRIAQRLAAASAARRGQAQLHRVPALETAIEYGDARIFGLNLARDLADYRAGKISWRDVDRGVCLHSQQPGLGKSTFAAVLSRACNVPLVSGSIGEIFATSPGFLDSIVKGLDDLFKRAATLAASSSTMHGRGCCLLHIDEVEAVPNRETLSEHGRSFWTPICNFFLTSLDSAITGPDGAGQRDGIVVLCSTNALHRVDPALLRPGRLEKSIEIKPPNLAGTLNILNFHLDGDLTGDLSEVGAMIEGSTGAEIMHTVRTARRIARHAGRAMIVDDLKHAALPIEEIPAARLFRMTVHEAAHAVVTTAIPAGIVKNVTLRSRGGSGGQTVVDFSNHALPTREMIEDRVVAGLAARAAEQIFTGAVSTGSGGSPDSDLGSATAMIAAVHASYGMGDDLVYVGAGDDLLHEVAVNSQLRARVERHLRELEVRAEDLVHQNRAAILAVAERLAVRRFLRGDEVREIMQAAGRVTSGKPGNLSH